MKMIFYLSLIIPNIIFSQNGIDYNSTIQDATNNVLIDKVSKSPITGEVYLLDDGVEVFRGEYLNGLRHGIQKENYLNGNPKWIES